MILPKERDPRFVTIRRGGVLTDADHRLLALWAAPCAEHVVHFLQSARAGIRDQLPEPIRELVLDDQRLRNEICWFAFDC